SFGHGPNALIAVGCFDIALGHLILHYVIVGDFWTVLAGARKSQLGAAAVDIVTIDGPVAAMPLGAFLVHRRAEFLEVTRRSGFTKKIAKNLGREGFVARFGEMKAIKRQ